MTILEKWNDYSGENPSLSQQGLLFATWQRSLRLQTSAVREVAEVEIPICE